MCDGCDNTVRRVAEILEVDMEEARRAYEAVCQAYGEEQDAEREAQEAEPDGPDAAGALDQEFLRVLAQAGAVTVVRPVLLGALPYILIQFVEGGSFTLEAGDVGDSCVPALLRRIADVHETQEPSESHTFP